MYLRLLIFTVTTLRTLQCSPYGHRSFPVENYPFFPGESPGFNPSRAANHPAVGPHRNKFWYPHDFPHTGLTVHGPQVDINSQPFGPIDDLPFQFDNGAFGNRPSRQNPQQIPQPGRPFNQRPNVNGGSSRQNFPARPQPGRPFNGRPSINFDPSRQNPPGTPISFFPPGGDDSEEVFVFDRPTSKRPPTTRRTTTTMATTTAITTTTPRNCDCPSTPEFNPVCGTNGQTYTNPGKLKCAVLCGTEVRVNYYGTCIATTESTPPSSTTAATSSRNNLF